VAYIVAIATHFWIDDSQVTQLGLWEVCPSGAGCSTISRDKYCTYGSSSAQLPDCDQVNATRAMAILAMIILLFALVLMMMRIYDRKGLRLWAALVCAISAGCGMIAMAVWLSWRQKRIDALPPGSNVDYKLGWSFAVFCVAWILVLIAALFQALVTPRCLCGLYCSRKCGCKC